MRFLNGTTLAEIVGKDIGVVIQSEDPQTTMIFCTTRLCTIRLGTR